MEKYDDFFKQDWIDEKIPKTQKINLDFSYQHKNEDEHKTKELINNGMAMIAEKMSGKKINNDIKIGEEGFDYNLGNIVENEKNNMKRKSGNGGFIVDKLDGTNISVSHTIKHDVSDNVNFAMRTATTIAKNKIGVSNYAEMENKVENTYINSGLTYQKNFNSDKEEIMLNLNIGLKF